MKLFANGCSFTWGGGIYSEFKFPISVDPVGLKEFHINFRKEHVWPYLLHQRLKTDELVNLATPGGSNYTIIRTTLDYFTTLLNNNKKVDDYIALIQWTCPLRFEIFIEELNSYTNFYKPDQPPYPKITGWKNKRYKDRFAEHEKNYLDIWYTQVIGLASFFNSHNIKYIFSTKDTLPINHYLSERINWIDSDLQILNTNQFRYSTLHPNLTGHELITERLYKRLQELYNI